MKSLQVLLKNPDLVSDTWLNFASALWFFVTPQAQKLTNCVCYTFFLSQQET
jgi:hypothetical protein